MNIITSSIFRSILKATDEKIKLDLKEIENFLSEKFSEDETFELKDIASDIGEMAGGYVHPKQIVTVLEDLEEKGKISKDEDTYTYTG